MNKESTILRAELLGKLITLTADRPSLTFAELPELFRKLLSALKLQRKEEQELLDRMYRFDII